MLSQLKVSIEQGTVTQKDLNQLSAKDWLTVIDQGYDCTVVEWILWKGSPQSCQWMLPLLQKKQVISQVIFRILKNGESGWHVALRLIPYSIDEY